jgi:hypothetical protein
MKSDAVASPEPIEHLIANGFANNQSDHRENLQFSLNRPALALLPYNLPSVK